MARVARFQHSQLITHFWSLCVEEQFYFVWPLFIYFCPKARLKSALLAIVLAGPLVRALLYHAVMSRFYEPGVEELGRSIYVLTPSHFDAFALGGFMALFPSRGSPKAFAAVSLVLLGAGIFVKVQANLPWRMLGFPLGLEEAGGYLWGYSLINLWAALLIDCLVHRKLFPNLADLGFLRYLGKISYGLYVFHFPMQWLVGRFEPHIQFAAQFALQLVLTFGAASLSYEFFESRVLDWKERLFPNAQPVPPVGGT